MKRTFTAFLLLLSSAVLSAQAPAAKWWDHIAYLAADRMKGRETGSPEHREAAEYIAKHFKEAGLQPGGTDGYFQPVRFRARRIVEEKSSLTLVRDGKTTPVVLGDEATFSMRIEPAPRVDAPLVFLGYGLQVPESKHDDLAGMDVKGKVALIMTGGPSSVPGPLLAHYSNTRWSYLKAAGAIGVVSIQNPKGQDIPWDRSKLSRFLPSMAIADPSLDDTLGQQLAVTVNADRADKFLEGSGHTIKELLDLSNAGKVLPRFAIPSAVRATVTIAAESLTSDNVVGILPGVDPVMKNEYVVISAHIDHVGVGTQAGDAIYNGAMDNASGIATLIETAAAAAARKSNKRSLIFLAVTAEEKGLLGSRYYASKPTVPPASIVADLNTDMFLPLFPLKSLIVQGLEESDLAGDLRKTARPMGVEVYSDPEPERNAFVRSDQYSFIRNGVPSISLKVGFVKDSPEHETVKRWRAERYHAPSDDLAQPIDRQCAEDFNRVYGALLEAVANRSTRPAWNADSFFKRFEQK
jgi:Zn-dependent M28 family amino/carboxypeptidase